MAHVHTHHHFTFLDLHWDDNGQSFLWFFSPHQYCPLDVIEWNRVRWSYSGVVDPCLSFSSFLFHLRARTASMAVYPACHPDGLLYIRVRTCVKNRAIIVELPSIMNSVVADIDRKAHRLPFWVTNCEATRESRGERHSTWSKCEWLLCKRDVQKSLYYLEHAIWERPIKCASCKECAMWFEIGWPRNNPNIIYSNEALLSDC